MFQVHPVAHLLGQFVPKVLVLQHLGATGLVVLVNAYLLADVLLGDAQLFLYAQFHGQTMGVPSGLAIHEITLLSLVAAEYVLNRAGHHMVDARFAVGRWGAVVEYERGMPLGKLLPFLKCLVLFPKLANLLANLGHV